MRRFSYSSHRRNVYFQIENLRLWSDSSICQQCQFITLLVVPLIEFSFTWTKNESIERETKSKREHFWMCDGTRSKKWAIHCSFAYAEIDCDASTCGENWNANQLISVFHAIAARRNNVDCCAELIIALSTREWYAMLDSCFAEFMLN